MSNPIFRSRFDGREPMLGTFLKIPALAAIEAVAEAGLDFIVIDQEHAPFDRAATDQLLFAARALGLPALVRVPSADPSGILSVLDAGAAGVLVPHVTSAEGAARVAAACRYRTGRGYSGAVRAARGPAGMRQTIERSDRDVIVIVQIEDGEAISQAGSIAACNGVDGLFIGRGDLAVSLGAETSNAPEVWDAARSIAAAGNANAKGLAAFAADISEARQLSALGVTNIVHGSDQFHLTKGIRTSATELRAAISA